MRCEHRTVRRAIRSGELEAAFIGGRWLVREETVDDWSVAEAPPSPSAFSCFCRGHWRLTFPEDG
ncbi:MAG: helix-turn-helix domain-containing protein [Solirubrobacteraceae bacterium]